MKLVAIVNYRMGNLDSVARAVEECGGSAFLANTSEDLQKAAYIILPGVGSFAIAMRNIRAYGFEAVLNEHVVQKGVPFLGICLGMQLMADKGWEGAETQGLGWVEGEVKRLEPVGVADRIPHIGWNEVSLIRNSPLFKGIPSDKDFYFVHSYHLVCKNLNDVFARTPYCRGFVSGVNKNNIYGVQFHPEKSQKLGFQVIKNFLAL